LCFQNDAINTWALQSPGVALRYDGYGSVAGKSALLKNKVDFAITALMPSQQDVADSGGELAAYPIVAGAVVPVCRIEGVDSAAKFVLTGARQHLPL
jgi:ABC-type phosphate transport system substrate-binding protein